MAKQETRADRRAKGWRPSPGLVLAAILIALALTFIVQNRTQVQIQLLIGAVYSPLWAALTSMLVVGLITGLFLHRRQRK